nr:hypothetical protein [Tanacetum cinerariifolium]
MDEMEENDLSNDDCVEIGDELFNDSDDKPVKDDHCSNLGMDSTQQDSCELKSEEIHFNTCDNTNVQSELNETCDNMNHKEFVIFDEVIVIEGIYYVCKKGIGDRKRSVEDLFGILCAEIRAKMVSITVKQTAKNIDGFGLWVNMGVIEMVGPQSYAAAADVDFGDIDFSVLLLVIMHKLNMGGGDGFDVEGDEDDSDTEEEVKEEEAVDQL